MSQPNSDMSSTSDHKRDIQAVTRDWLNPAYEFYSRASEDLKEDVNTIKSCKGLKVCCKVNTVLDHEVLREWLSSTKKRILYLDGCFKREGEHSRDSYVTAVVANFLFKRSNYLVLTYCALHHKEFHSEDVPFDQDDMIWKVDVLHMFRSLTAQLLNQIWQRRREVDLSCILASRVNWNRVQNNKSTLIKIIHEILARLKGDDAVYIIIDLGFVKCEKEDMEEIVNLTKEVDVVKVLISQPDDKTFGFVRGEAGDYTVHIDNDETEDADDTGDEASRVIDLEGKTYKEWERGTEEY